MADIKKIKIGNTTYDIVDAGAARKEQVVTVVDTLADVPNNEFGLYRHAAEEGGSNLVEVVSTLHEGGEGNTFTKTTTANNQSVTATAILSHFDTTLSNFVAVTEATQVYTLYQAFNGEPVISGLRLGSSKNQGSLTLEFLQDGQIIVSKYFTINGSTGEVASSDASSQVIVDGTTYMLASESDFVEIPVTAGTHTITSGSGSGTRAILIGFSFSSEAFYTFEKKYLARQEGLDSLAEVVTKNNNEATTKHADFESRITKNTQDISALGTTLGNVQIFDVKNSLPRASMTQLDKIYRKDTKLYQCIKTGDGDHKDFAFNLSGTSEILDAHLEQLYPTIAKDFEDYFVFDLENSSKVFRNNGSIKLGSSSATGDLRLECQDSRDLTALKIGVKAYNTKKSSFEIEVGTVATDFAKKILVEDATKETFIDFTADFNEIGVSPLLGIWISSTESYVDEETDDTTITDKRGVITRIIADFGDVSYEWIPVTGDIKVTHAELVALRTKSQLIPGQFYRIIDYQCTTSQENTKAMDHQFDIIVQALSENTLSENVSADYHAGESYFGSIGTVDLKGLLPLKENAIQPVYYIMVDEEVGEEFKGDEEGYKHGDIFVAYDYKENSEGTLVPVIYKNDIDYEADGEFVDTQDAFWYVGTYDYDDTTYDRWQKAEYGNFNLNASDDGSGSCNVYILTDIIVENNIIPDEYIKVTTTANLPAWELKYCLDNNTSRFAWASTLPAAIKIIDDITYIYVRYNDGDGQDGITWAYVIDSDNLDFSEISDWANIDSSDLIYTDNMSVSIGDSLLMGSAEVTVVDTSIGKGVIYYMKDEYNNEAPYDFKNIQFLRKLNEDGNLDLENGEDTWCYTFGGLIDRSIKQEGLHTFNNNSIGTYYEGCSENFLLPDNVFLGSYNECMSKDNKLGSNCTDNTFGSRAQSNLFGENCCSNTFSSECFSNTFGDSCDSNTFGSYCEAITFGNNCGCNTFGDSCSCNTFGLGCSYNTFGNDCYSNTFGNDCGSNAFGNDCDSNTFGNDCGSNTFAFDDANKEPLDHFRYINFADGCKYIYLLCDETGSDDYWVQHITISSGVSGTADDNRREISMTRCSADTIKPIVYEANNTTHIILD